MKILQIHNEYKYFGGEDQIVEREKNLLLENNHEVIQLIRKNNKEIKNLYDQIIVNEGLQDQMNLTVVLESIQILDLPKYRQQEGNYKHFPFRFWAGNRLLGGYSDHLAIKVEIKKISSK